MTGYVADEWSDCELGYGPAEEMKWYSLMAETVDRDTGITIEITEIMKREGIEDFYLSPIVECSESIQGAYVEVIASSDLTDDLRFMLFPDGSWYAHWS